MSAFSAEWLALREPYDRDARSRRVLDATARALTGRFSVTVVDLACGTGSTLRTLAPHLPYRQSWRLVDNDLGLLARAAGTAVPDGVSLKATPVDLAHDLEAALDGTVDLVTCSALLDLVSADWLDRFVVETAVRGLPVYAALSYDGRIELAPADPFDGTVLGGFNRHQRTDKAFGPALGPDAFVAAMQAFERTGYGVTKGLSDWVLGADDAPMQSAMLQGLAQAADEIGALSRVELQGWLARRQGLVSSGQSRLRVGHGDFLAQPITRR